MKKDWTIKKLGDLCEVITKGTTPTSIGYEFQKTGINFIKVETFSMDGFLLPDKVAHISKECNEALKRSQLKEGDILFSIAGALGRTAIVDKSILPANTNQALAIIRLYDKNPISLKYLIYYFGSEAIKKQIDKDKGGVAQQNLSLKQISEFDIYIPPLEEQKRIVAVLDKKFAQIETLKTAAEKNLQNTKQLFQAELEKAFSNTSWEKKKLGDVFNMVRGPFGGSLKKECFKPNGYPVYEQQNAIYSKFDFRYFIDESKYQEMKRFTVLPGDFIMSCSGTMGKVAIVPESAPIGIINQALLKMSPSKTLYPSYVKYYMDSPFFKQSLMKDAQGAAIQNVASVKILKEIELPLPSLEEQKRIVAHLDSLSEKVHQLEEIYTKQLADCDELKQSLLQKAFEGEL